MQNYTKFLNYANLFAKLGEKRGKNVRLFAYVKKKQYLCSRKGFLNMKKSLIIGLIALGALVGVGLTSCEIHNGENCKFHSQSKYLAVDPGEWKYDQDNLQYYAHFDIEELTSNVYNYGNYSLHRVYNVGTKDEYQVALPQSIFKIENVQDEEGNTSEYYYTQEVDYRVGVGYVEIQVTNSDYFYEEDSKGSLVPPERMDFHLQLIW